MPKIIQLPSGRRMKVDVMHNPAYSEEAQRFVSGRMRDFYARRMKSSSGETVSDPQQAKAIALSEAREKGMTVPAEPDDG